MDVKYFGWLLSILKIEFCTFLKTVNIPAKRLFIAGVCKI